MEFNSNWLYIFGIIRDRDDSIKVSKLVYIYRKYCINTAITEKSSSLFSITRIIDTSPNEINLDNFFDYNPSVGHICGGKHYFLSDY